MSISREIFYAHNLRNRVSFKCPQFQLEIKNNPGSGLSCIILISASVRAIMFFFAPVNLNKIIYQLITNNHRDKLQLIALYAQSGFKKLITF